MDTLNLTEDGADYILVDKVTIGVGEIFVTTDNGKETVANITLLQFKDLRSDDTYKIAIPMNTDIGDSFFTGEINMQIREMWNEWFEENHDL